MNHWITDYNYTDVNGRKVMINITCLRSSKTLDTLYYKNKDTNIQIQPMVHKSKT